MKPKFLLITRNYPPKVGGLETYSYNLIKEFETNFETYKVVLTKSNRHLIWYLPYCLVMALYIIWKHDVKYVHLCDAMLSPVGFVLKIFSAAQISTTVAGLDITFRNFFYQLIVPRCAARLDIVICISRATRDECIARGVSPDKCRVIPVGIRCKDAPTGIDKKSARRELEELINIRCDGKLLLVTVGRLVKRKGVAWFVENVVPLIDEAILYLIVGAGPEHAGIKNLIRENALSDRVFMLGEMSDDHRNIVLNASDIFIMPNIVVDGDIEGFGIVALEAGCRGLPVIASNLQGIRDAVIDGRTGYLVEEGDSADFAARIGSTNLDAAATVAIVKENFDWPHIAGRYFDELLSRELRPLVNEENG